MKLHSKLAQKIIDEIKEIDHHVINIMDNEGVIIASTNEERIGELHPGAQMVIKTGDYYIMGEEEAKQYLRVIPGISLPIVFEEEIIGVIGIGDGTESSIKLGRLLKKTVELLLKQEYANKDIYKREQEFDRFLNRIITESYEGNEAYIEHCSSEFDIDLEQPFFLATVWHNNLQAGSNNNIQEYRKNIERHQNLFTSKLIYYGLNVIFLSDCFVLLLPYRGNMEDLATFKGGFVERLLDIINPLLDGNYYVGLGKIAESMRTIHQCFQEELIAVKLACALQSYKKVVEISDYYDIYMMLHLPYVQKKKFYEEVFGRLLLEKEAQREQWITTLDAFFRNDMGLVKTANELYIHRNSLIFRLNRIHYLTGYHPQSFNGAKILFQALTMYKLERLDKKEKRIIDSII